jgi:hypothetical protein
MDGYAWKTLIHADLDRHPWKIFVHAVLARYVTKPG